MSAIVHVHGKSTQRAIGHREAPRGQNGVAVGRVSPIVGEKVCQG